MPDRQMTDEEIEQGTQHVEETTERTTTETRVDAWPTSGSPVESDDDDGA